MLCLYLLRFHYWLLLKTELDWERGLSWASFFVLRLKKWLGTLLKELYNKFMRVIALYRPNSEHARRIEDYVTEFQRLHPSATLEMQSIDTVEGADMVALYGIMEYPAILALASDGQVQQQWQGDGLPLMNDLVYYTNQ